MIFISFCFLVSVGYGVTYYTGLGDHLGIECNHFLLLPGLGKRSVQVSWWGMYIRSFFFMVVILYRLWLYLLVGFVIFLLSVILCVRSGGGCCLSLGWGTLGMG